MDEAGLSGLIHRANFWESNAMDRVQIDALMADPSVSDWLKGALTALLARDAVDAAKDADLLARIMGERVDALLKR
jgi:hypothetical protein